MALAVGFRAFVRSAILITILCIITIMFNNKTDFPYSSI